MLILIAGLPGSGKTTVARQLADRMKAVVLSKDTARHALFPPELVEYSTVQDDFVIEVLLLTAVYIWSRNPQQIIILDGRTFSTAAQRQHVIGFAERAGQAWRLVECVCPGEIARRRLSQPDSTHPASNRTPELYDEVKRRWEAIIEPKIRIDTSASLDLDRLVRDLLP